MRNEGRLTKKMLAFLQGIRDRLLVLPALVARENIDPRRLSRWLRIVAFRQTLDDVVKELRVRVRLELDVLAGCAVRELSEMLRLKRPDEKMVALCAAIIEAQRRSRLDARMARRRHRRRARAEDGRSAGRRELCHPNSRDREDELLAILAAPHEEEQSSADVAGAEGARTASS